MLFKIVNCSLLFLSITLNKSKDLQLFKLPSSSQLTWKSRFEIQREKLLKRNSFNRNEGGFKEGADKFRRHCRW